MDFLELESARKILETIAAQEGLLTWYNIIKYIASLGLEVDPPEYIVFQELIKYGYISPGQGPRNNNSKYSLTDLGREFLSKKS